MLKSAFSSVAAAFELNLEFPTPKDRAKIIKQASPAAIKLRFKAKNALAIAFVGALKSAKNTPAKTPKSPYKIHAKSPIMRESSQIATPSITKPKICVIFIIQAPGLGILAKPAPIASSGAPIPSPSAKSANPPSKISPEPAI